MILDVDPENYTKDVSPRGLGVALTFASPMVALACMARTRDWIGAAPNAVVATLFSYVLVYSTNVVLLKQNKLLTPAWWPARVAGCLSAAAFVSSFAATTRTGASLAWVSLFILAMAIALAVRPTPLMLPILAAPAVGLRAIFVPGATPESLFLAAFVALGAHGIFLRVATVVLRERRAASQAKAADVLAKEAVSRAAELKVAMSLHDGLSGSLLAARRRIGSDGQLEEALVAARVWLLKLRAALERSFAEAGETIEHATLRIAGSLAVPLELSVRASRDPDAEERGDLLAILSELVANAAAHAEGEGLHVALSLTPRGVAAAVVFGKPLADGAARGRGFRNLELRVARHGGTIDRDASGLRFSWPRSTTLEAAIWRAGAEVAFIVVLCSAGLAWIEPRMGPVIVGGITAIFMVFVIRDRLTRAAQAEASLERARKERVAAEEGEQLAVAGEALGPAVRVAEAALSTRDRPALASAFEDLATRLRDLMWALEWSGTVDSLREDLAEVARQTGTELPSVPASACQSARERFLLASQLRHRSTEPTVA